MKPLDGVQIVDEWLQDTPLQSLFDILCADGGMAMIAGGAVRNALMKAPASDIDLCTTLLPEEVVSRLEASGYKAVPTGIEHGTITAIIDELPFEVTTLREDIETDGRHAVVKFGTDWEADAQRRDLTMNGLFCDRRGYVYDFVEGYTDIQTQTVRFIGEADTRIKEDALRILRFFRFFAWYGSGRPDAAGLKACNANKMLMSGLSVERVWMELKKLLAAPDPSRALLWMRTTGILGGVLPETVKWGIDAIPGLIRIEQALGWEPDFLLRLMAMIRPHGETVDGIAKRMLFSNVERDRLSDWAATAVPAQPVSNDELARSLYRGSRQGLIDAMRLEIVHLQNRDEEAAADNMVSLVAFAEAWEKPEFPVKGQDLIDAGVMPGKELGNRLHVLEERWIESGFNMGKADLLNSQDQTSEK
ncbi:MAG: CCA tRNA nucleotidyltransferase [Rhizobiaceae bacterium]|nr:CCA tRNA nucleotidyltransferase [Rhizobiaceae bacterium]